MADQFSLRMAKVFIGEAMRRSNKSDKRMFLVWAAKRRLEYLEFVKARNKVQLELF